MLGMNHLLGQGLLVAMCTLQLVVVPLLTCLYCNGLLLTDVLPPLCCGDQLECLHLMDEGGDRCVTSLEVQMLEVCQPW